MIFDSKNDAFEWFNDYQVVNRSEYEAFASSEAKIQMGDWILFRHICDKGISRPILGLFVGYTVWDMALVVQYIPHPRAWWYSNKIGDNEIHSHLVGERDAELETIAIWHDNLHLLGNWHMKPSFRDLRQVLQPK